MAIVDEDLELLRASLVLSDVVQQYVALRRVGRNWVGLCPFHAERTGSFNVRDETGRYKCFGCGAGGDAFKFVQEIEHVDFVAAVESLAAKANVQLRYTTGEVGDRQRQKRRQLIESMGKAVEWYHQRLLESPDARGARDYLRRRGLAGDVARTFKLGWAPDDWDAMSKDIGVPSELLRDVGLAFTNKAGRVQDSFRARVLFPIYGENGDPVAFGGRVLPGSSDPAKYKNSSETAIYAKSKTLYGLNWAKADIVAADQVIVCEGYTDVIGFHRAGIKRAVATCGTALTEDHVRLLKRYATQVVLAFDADAAGQGAAQRFYEWEERYQVSVGVAQFPKDQDPGDLSINDPDALRQAVDQALPFLGFRVNRVLNSRKLRSPEDRAQVAGQAMAVINEHPNREVRKLYAGQVASHVAIPPGDLVALADRGAKSPVVRVTPLRKIGSPENAEFVAIAMLLQRWDDIAPWLMEELFVDEVARRAFLAVADSAGAVEAALDLADPEAREFLERAAVADVEADPVLEARNLIAAATRRRLATLVTVTDPEAVRAIRDARLALEEIEQTDAGDAGAEALLGWLQAASEGSSEQAHG
ncbi:MAG: DNA primase [Actinobacteria bacterium]|nr:DNA primase [Actinomycetota bacterium]